MTFISQSKAFKPHQYLHIIMKGSVMNYRGSHKTQDTKRMIIQPENSKTKEDAEKLIGKKVTWTSPAGKKISGTITKPHGNSGAVLARFDEAGLPGQALGTEILIE